MKDDRCQPGNRQTNIIYQVLVKYHFAIILLPLYEVSFSIFNFGFPLLRVEKTLCYVRFVGIRSAGGRVRDNEMNYLAECRYFFREFWQRYHDTGSILPSSRFLARALTSELQQPRGACRILEAGPGTGAVTRAILHQLLPADLLDVVEINERFAALLQRRLDEEEEFRALQQQVRLLQAPVQDVRGESVYDFIISGLPLNNFSVQLVQEILSAFRRLIKPGGVLSYFEYLCIRELKMPFVGRQERCRLRAIGRLMDSFVRDHQVRRQVVFLNVPPAVARHLVLK